TARRGRLFPASAPAAARWCRLGGARPSSGGPATRGGGGRISGPYFCPLRRALGAPPRPASSAFTRVFNGYGRERVGVRGMQGGEGAPPHPNEIVGRFLCPLPASGARARAAPSQQLL